jgi:hypothetical protein
MGGLQRYDTGRTCSFGIMFEKEHVIQCYVTPIFEADDEDKKIYVKATEKNYKTSTMTINLITKRM